MKKTPDLDNNELEKKKILSALHNDLFQKMLISLSTYNLIQKEALRFLKKGYKSYTKRNVFNLPGMELTPEEILILQLGCEQFRNNMGLTNIQPFAGLGISGLFRLMKIFYYLPVGQEIYSTEAGFNMDKITFKHTFGQPDIVLYNQVKCS